MGATINNESSTTEPPPKNGQLPKPLGAGDLNAHSSEILLLLKRNNCLAGMEKTDCFCYGYPDSSLSKKKIFSICIKFVLIFHAAIAK